MKKFCIEVALSIFLLGCGGGSHDDEDVAKADIQPVDCTAKAEGCR
jgi:hypothetical protein